MHHVTTNSPIVREAKKEAFLAALAVSGHFGAAAAAAGVAYSTQKVWREDEAFEERVVEAIETYKGSLVTEATLRARDGIREPVIFAGKMCYMHHPITGELMLDDNLEPIPLTLSKKSDRLMEVLLEANVEQFKKKGAIDLGAAGALPKKIIVEFVDADEPAAAPAAPTGTPAE